MKNYICASVQYLIKIFIEKFNCNSMKTKDCLSQTNNEANLKALLYICNCPVEKAEEIL